MRIVVPTLTIILLSISYFYLLSYGSFNIQGRSDYGAAYDSLGENLLRGSAEVDPNTILWEGFKVEGKTFMYFGPWPALLRILANACLPEGRENWATLSCFLAALLSLMAIFNLCKASFISGSAYQKTHSTALTAATLLFFGLGSPLFYLVTSRRIYHEAIIWALCASLWGLVYILRLLKGQSNSFANLTGLAFAAAIALLSRITFGIPLYLALVIFAMLHLRRQGLTTLTLSKNIFRTGICFFAIAPAVLGLMFQAWYNYNRFGAIWKAIDFSKQNADIFQRGGIFAIERLPSSLFNYFGFDFDFFSTVAPYIVMSPTFYFKPEIFCGWKEVVVPLLVSTPLLVAILLLGTWSLARKHTWLPMLIFFCFLFQFGAILVFWFVTARYSAEFVPGILFLFFWMVSSGYYLNGSRSVTIFSLLGVFSIAATILSASSWIMYFAAPDTDVGAPWVRQVQRYFLPTTHFPLSPSRIVFATEVASDQKLVLRNVKLYKNTEGGPISANGFISRFGIGMRPDARIDFAVPPGAVKFRMTAGPDDRQRSCFGFAAKLSVYSDAVKMYEHSFRHYLDPSERVSLPLTGAHAVITVKVERLEQETGSGADCSFINLFRPQFVLGEDKKGAPQTVPTGQKIYLSDLQPLRIEGEEALLTLDRQIDGAPIRMQGKVFKRGIGMHSNLNVDYAVPDRAHYFVATVGFADSIVKRCNKSSVMVTILGEGGEILFESGLMTFRSRSKSVILNVEDTAKLTLVVWDAGDVVDCDWTDWGAVAFILPDPN
ncbi:NPCBM/NEW2 domain-containing protein [Oligoflexia bacterium]|nr:NPCBM/NEW2 domain-containing protein [Oligoflexia bacterium]